VNVIFLKCGHAAYFIVPVVVANDDALFSAYFDTLQPGQDRSTHATDDELADALADAKSRSAPVILAKDKAEREKARADRAARKDLH
jgi:hypothetical protein